MILNDLTKVSRLLCKVIEVENMIKPRGSSKYIWIQCTRCIFYSFENHASNVIRSSTNFKYQIIQITQYIQSRFNEYICITKYLRCGIALQLQKSYGDRDRPLSLDLQPLWAELKSMPTVTYSFHNKYWYSNIPIIIWFGTITGKLPVIHTRYDYIVLIP